MNHPITASAVPPSSHLAAQLPSADFFDAYAMPLAHGDARSAMEIYLDIVAVTPGWINCLMAARNRIVSLVGIKNVGHVGAVDPDKTAASYRPGDRVGIFSLRSVSDDEVILGDADRHVDAQVSVCRIERDGRPAVALTTVVHIHNLLGRTYMAFVVPLHRRIVPAALKRAWEQQQSGVA